MFHCPEVVFKGEKVFENYEKRVKFLIVNHEEFGCIEVIVLGLSSRNHNFRIYLNFDLLFSKIDRDQFNTTFKIMQDAAGRRKRLFLPEVEVKMIGLNMISATLVNRLQIVPSTKFNEFDLFFKPSESDIPIIRFNAFTSYITRLDFEFEKKPRDLKPYIIIQSLSDQKR